MLTNPVSASLGVKVEGRGGQGLVILLAILAALSLIGTGIFLWHRHEMWPVPAAFTVWLTWFAARIHGEVHAADSRASAPKTKLTPNAHGVTVETDPGTLADPIAVEHLQHLIANAAFRKPLPHPDGEVRSDGTFDVSEPAKARARERVIEANRAAKQGHDDTIALLTQGHSSNEEVVAQPRLSRPSKPMSKGRVEATTEDQELPTGHSEGRK